MKLIQIMNYADPGRPIHTEPKQDFAVVRRAARAVVIDQAGGVYLMHAARDGYYKLPGGGIDAGESREEALHREVKEEMGARITILRPVGRTVQFDEHDSFRQDSFCYLTQLDGELGVPALTEGEAEAGFRVERFDGFEQAIVAIEKGGQQVACAHMTVRDAALLRAARGV